MSEGILYRPERGRRWLGIIHLTDIGGIRPAHCDMGRRLAAEGYTVLMPNVFIGPGVRPVRLQAEHGRIRANDEANRRTNRPFDAGGRRARRLELPPTSSLPLIPLATMGAVGYCATGSMAIRIAAARPDRIGAGRIIPRDRLFTEAPTSPHLVLPRIKAALYFGYAVQDRSMPEEAIEKLDRA